MGTDRTDKSVYMGILRPSRLRFHQGCGQAGGAPAPLTEGAIVRLHMGEPLSTALAPIKRLQGMDFGGLQRTAL